MRTNYLRHLANTIGIQWSKPVWGRGGGGVGNSQLNWLTCSKRQKSVETLRLQTSKHDSLLEVIDGQSIKFNFFVKIIQTISNYYVYHKYMTYHIHYSIFLKETTLILFFAFRTECS